MPLDFNAVINKKYNILPVPPSLIASNHNSKQQILWVGCSDSLISETSALAVEPEEIFVHRNLGNILSNRDASSGSALELCLDILKVGHIVVCGHYDCRLIKPGVDHRWYKDVTKIHSISERHLSTSDGTLDERSKDRRLEEVYVLAEVDWLKKQPNVKKAVEERGLTVHAFVYDKETNGCVMLMEVEEEKVTLKNPWMKLPEGISEMA